METTKTKEKEEEEEKEEGISRSFEGIGITEAHDELHNTRRTADGRSVET